MDYKKISCTKESLSPYKIVQYIAFRDVIDLNNKDIMSECHLTLTCLRSQMQLLHFLCLHILDFQLYWKCFLNVLL